MFPTNLPHCSAKTADDAHRLMNACHIAQGQVRVLLAFQHIIVLDERLTEKFEGQA